MFLTANVAAKLSASKIITMLCLLAGACCAKGASSCDTNGGDEYMCLERTVGSNAMEDAQGTQERKEKLWRWLSFLFSDRDAPSAQVQPSEPCVFRLFFCLTVTC